MKKLMKIITLSTLLGTALAANASAEPQPSSPIEHIIVIYLENHSFDNVFGKFPKAEGIANATFAAQTDTHGTPYQTLPTAMNTNNKPASVDPRFPTDLPNRPFAIEKYIASKEKTGDLMHRFYEEQGQIDQGQMDRFAALSDAGGLTMGYFDGSKLGLWKYARKYTLADHFFHAAFGGSFLNHFWLVCSCTPTFPHAPEGLVIQLDEQGKPMNKGTVTSDGFAVNTLFSVNTPHPDIKDASKLLPAQDAPTIGDRLSEKNISWAWYSGGWNDAVAGHPDASFQFHHQPFAYFKTYADGTPARAEHLKDESDFVAALKEGTLPAVAFYKPLGEFNLHPGYTDVASGDAHIVELLHAIEKSKVWKSSVVIITFDENGGYWDHVAPPKVDRWGPGVRVPTLIVSPFAKKHFVDHTVYDTTSILKFIEGRFGLEPLGSRDAGAGDLNNALSLPQPAVSSSTH